MRPEFKILLLTILHVKMSVILAASKAQVVPDLTKMEGLICYQCESNGTEMISLCDTAFFKTLSVSERFDIMFQCPSSAQDYCIRKTNITGNKLQTFRGCADSLDANNATVRNGCITINQGKTTTQICLCNTNLCNRSHTRFKFYLVYSYICITIFILNKYFK